MNTNVTTTGNANPFEAYGEAIVNRHIIGQLLKFAKGDYVTGDGVEIPLGTRMIAIMSLLLVGWIRWQDGVPTEHRMGAVVDGHMPLRRAELGDADESSWEVDEQGRPRDPWQLSNYLVLIDERTKSVYTLPASSRGGLGAVGELSKKYGKHIRQAPDELPIIKLSVGSYQHRDKAFGRIKFPVFDVVGWTDSTSYLEMLEGSSSVEPVKPAKLEPAAISHEKEERAAKAKKRGFTNVEDTF